MEIFKGAGDMQKSDGKTLSMKGEQSYKMATSLANCT